MRVVVALGGNALIRRGQTADVATQRANAELAARAIAELAAEHELIVTHGNGPQVGLLALQSVADAELPAYPLDVLGAETEGMIGYLLELALRRCLPDREIATLLTQVEVSADDAGFAAPTKPIGPIYPEAEARSLKERRGWFFVPDGDGLRRAVPSPQPLRILELASIAGLVDARVIVICAGGGGIPVVRRADGVLEGIEAVVDKDLTAALLARQLGADALLLLTDVAAVYRDWPGTSDPIRVATADALRGLGLEAGTMGPKVEAACRFAVATGGIAAIGALEQAAAVLENRAGTRVRT